MSDAPYPPGHIDPVTLARFMVMPGAAALVEAYSRIPPGPLRESIISHAQVMALTYDGAPVANRMPDPLLLAAGASPQHPPPALDGPKSRAPKLASPAARAVELRLSGIRAARIAQRLNMPKMEVEAALADARAAGLKFPRDPPSGRAGHVTSTGYLTRMEDLGGRERAVMDKAARSYGIKLERYLELRALLVELRKKNTPIEELAVALKPLRVEVIWRLITQARNAGIDIPARLDFDDAEFTPIVEPTPEPGPAAPRRFYPPFAELSGGSRAAITNGARSRGIEPEAYHELRELILTLRMQGMSPSAIERQTGEGRAVTDIIQQAGRVLGLVFPPVDKATKPPPGPPPVWRKPDTRKPGERGFWLTIDEVSPQGQTMAKLAAEALNTDLEGYGELRRKALAMFREGRSPARVAADLGLSTKQASNWKDRAVSAGLLQRIAS